MFFEKPFSELNFGSTAMAAFVRANAFKLVRQRGTARPFDAEERQQGRRRAVVAKRRLELHKPSAFEVEQRRQRCLKIAKHKHGV